MNSSVKITCLSVSGWSFMIYHDVPYTLKPTDFNHRHKYQLIVLIYLMPKTTPTLYVSFRTHLSSHRDLC